MPETIEARGLLVNLAAEGMAGVITGCAQAMANDKKANSSLAYEGAVPKAINYFGPHIVERWIAGLTSKTEIEQQDAFGQLASMPSVDSRSQATASIERLAGGASQEDKLLAVEYLAAIPLAIRRSLVHDPETGRVSLPCAVTLADGHMLIRLLPPDVPPFPIGSNLPGTTYVLEELLGIGGFGAVYKAMNRCEQHQPARAIKFCLDASMIDSLHREQAILDRLMAVESSQWSERIVRLYGYALDAKPPFLVYEYVPGGDLTTNLRIARQKTGKGFRAALSLELMRQVAEALAFAHKQGLVHRDLKPANVLVSGSKIKLTDFGIGGVVASQVMRGATMGGSVMVQARDATQQSLNFRGSGTPLYMSPEQRRGDQPDPRHDLFSLGVMWYQLLVGDVSKELHPGWPDELIEEFQTPAEHIDIIQRCVGYFKKRPAHGAELLTIMPRPFKAEASPAVSVAVGQAVVAPAPGSQAKPVAPSAAPLIAPKPPAAPAPIPTPMKAPTAPSAPPVAAQAAPAKPPAPPPASQSSPPAVAPIAPARPQAVAQAPPAPPAVAASRPPLPGRTTIEKLQPEKKEFDRLHELLAEQIENDALHEARDSVARMLKIKPNDPETVEARDFLDERLTKPITEIESFTNHEGWVRGVAVSSDGRKAISGGDDQQVLLWDLAGRRQSRSFVGHEAGITGVVFSPDSTMALSASWDGTARLWEIETGEELRRFEGDWKSKCMAFSPDGSAVLLGGDDKLIHLFDIESGDESKRVEGHTDLVQGVAFSPDGSRIVSGSDDGTVRVWDLESGEQICCFTGHGDNSITSVAYAPNSRWVLSGGTDNTARLWDLQANKELRRFEGHKNWINCVGFAPNALRIITGSGGDVIDGRFIDGDDKTIRIWDLQNERELYRFNRHQASVTCVAFTPGGRHLVAGSLDKTVRLLAVPS